MDRFGWSVGELDDPLTPGEIMMRSIAFDRGFLRSSIDFYLQIFQYSTLYGSLSVRYSFSLQVSLSSGQTGRG